MMQFLRFFLLFILFSCGPKSTDEELPDQVACRSEYMTAKHLYDSEYLSEDGKTLWIPLNQEINIKPKLNGWAENSDTYKFSIHTLRTKEEALKKLEEYYQTPENQPEDPKEGLNPIEGLIYEFKKLIGHERPIAPGAKRIPYETAKAAVEESYKQKGFFLLPEGISIKENGTIVGKTNQRTENQKLSEENRKGKLAKSMVNINWSRDKCVGGANFDILTKEPDGNG